MTKEELKKRINEDFVILVAFGVMSSCDPNEFFRKLGITHLSDVNAQSQFIAFVVGILKQKKQVEEFALKNLEEQEKCCGNCDNSAECYTHVSETRTFCELISGYVDRNDFCRLGWLVREGWG